MDTLRLRALPGPERTLVLLESFAMQQRHVGPDAYRKRRLRDLPMHLRRHVGRGAAQQYTWFAWEAGDRVYLVTASPVKSPLPRRDLNLRFLEIRNYDHDGRLLDHGTWMLTRNTGRWERFSTT